MTSVLQALDAFGSLQLSGLANASVPSKPHLKWPAHACRGRSDAINQLRSSADSLPAPMADWLKTLAADSWMLVLNDAYQYLNQRYRKRSSTRLITTSVGKRYPFAANSESDVALADFREFFQGSGNGRQLLRPVPCRFRQRQQRRLPTYGVLMAAACRCHVSFSTRWLPCRLSAAASLPKIRTSRRSCSSLEPHSLDSSLGRANFRFGNQKHGVPARTYSADRVPLAR